MKCKNRSITTLGISLFFLYGGIQQRLEAASATNFYDSSTNDLGASLWLVYTNGPEDKTVYLKFPRDTYVVSSKVTLTGDWVNNALSWGKNCNGFCANLTFAWAAIAFADLDSDGDSDIILADSGAGGVRGYRNVGTSNSPSWQSDANLVEGIAELSLGPTEGGMATLGDLDNDGDYDLILGDRYAFIGYRNTGTTNAPSWTQDSALITNLTGDSYDHVCCKLVDLDADNDLDLVFGRYYKAGEDRRPFGRRNIGTVSNANWENYTNFVCNLDTNLQASYPAFADLDNDSDPDLIMGVNGYKTRAWRNDGSNPIVWTETPAWTNGIPDFYHNQAPALADLDADGDYDLFCSGYKTFLSYENTGDVTFAAWTNISDLSTGITPCDEYPTPTFGDLDGDGDSDCLIFSCRCVFGYKNIGTPSQPLFQYYPDFATNLTAYQGSGSTLADLDNDGDLDIIRGAYGGIAAYRNTGSTNSPSWSGDTNLLAGASVGTGTFSAPTLADLDDDGDLDMIVTGGSTNIFGYENIGTKWVPLWSNNSSLVTGLPAGGQEESACLGDLDNDGDYDLIIRAYNLVYRNTGTKKSPAWTLDSTLNQPNVKRAGLADLDNDGDLDSVGTVTGWSGGTVFGYRNDSTRYYPVSFTMDIGTNESVEWGPNTWTNTTSIEISDTNSSFSAGVQAYINSHQESEYILVPLEFHSATNGKVFLSNLEIIYGPHQGTVIQVF